MNNYKYLKYKNKYLKYGGSTDKQSPELELMNRCNEECSICLSNKLTLNY